MNRRVFLTRSAAVAGSVAIAGCSSDSGGSDGGDDDGGGSPADTATPTPSWRDRYPNAYYYHEPTGILLEGGVTAEANSIGALYIRGVAQNTTDEDYSYVQVTFTVLDDTDAKIGDALANTSGLAAGQRWRYEAMAASAERASSYQLQDVTAY